ncbi:hypothetical protein B0H21DRAFT_779412 [Amylocystis lapponica]|nr:hypothetical protein B0H21DRAFT_779412 [Amylocystis lapponica]
MVFKLDANSPRPLARHLGISVATCTLLFISFLLFLLVGLSLPITKSIYILSVQLNTTQPVSPTATELRFGVWGVCALSVLPGYEVCSPPALGYTIPQQILDYTGETSLIDGIVEGLTVLLVLHPVCAALAFVCMLTSLFLESHAAVVTSLVLSVLTVILACAVFAADVALVLVARIRIPQLSAFAYNVDFGPAVWMVLAALILLWTGMVLLSVVACECCGTEYSCIRIVLSPEHSREKIAQA